MMSYIYGKLNIHFRSIASTFLHLNRTAFWTAPAHIHTLTQPHLFPQSVCISFFLPSPLFTTLLSYFLTPHTPLSYCLAHSSLFLHNTLLSLPINLKFSLSLAFLVCVGGVVVGARSVQPSPGRAVHSVLQQKFLEPADLHPGCFTSLLLEHQTLCHLPGPASIYAYSLHRGVLSALICRSVCKYS